MDKSQEKHAMVTEPETTDYILYDPFILNTRKCKARVKKTDQWCPGVDIGQMIDCKEM